MRVLPIHPPRALPLPVQAAVVLLACILLFWVGIGSSGFNQSEGFRVFPAHEMLDSGDWVVPRLFGQAYLRKPPGVPWAIACFSELLGRTEFAARATCAFAVTLSCLATLIASRRWFGPRFSLLAALAHALTPLFWYSARSAEIEAINNLFTQLCVFTILDTLLFPRTGRLFRPLAGLGIALATAGLLLCKGPASLPCIGAAMLAGAIVHRRLAAAFNPYALGAIALGCVPFFVWLYLATLRSKGLDPVTQTPGRFLWDPEHLLETLLLVPRAGASALPWSAVLIVPLVLLPRSRRASGHARLGEHDERNVAITPADRVARALALTTLLALLIYTLTGIHNVRYTMPALTFFFPLVAWFWSRNLGLNPASLAIAPPHAARAWQVAPVIVLAIAACVWLPMEEKRRARNSGREVGRQLADALPHEARLWGDLMFDTRPEVFYYAAQRAAEQGKRPLFRWIPDRGQDILHPPWSPFWAVRTDDRDEFNQEFRKMSARGWLVGWDPVFQGDIQRGRFTFTVYKWRRESAGL
jgi:4-amino-4-deoxy-L-arabinose transferase-like glycosyltransferase